MTERASLLRPASGAERPGRARRHAGKRRRLMRLVKIERHHRAEQLEQA
ncbi:MAG TPA: hypothetical protein VFA82_03530 [Gaiellaceae bacterium]|nr:hypothetical protein [Gaiellaceae bacterium]